MSLPGPPAPSQSHLVSIEAHCVPGAVSHIPADLLGPCGPRPRLTDGETKVQSSEPHTRPPPLPVPPAASHPPLPSLFPRCESSSEDSSTAENFSDNESTENETPEPEARVPGVAEAAPLRPPGTAAAKIPQEECQPAREAQRVPTAEGASGSNVEEIRSVFWAGGRARVVWGMTLHPTIPAF